MDSGCSQVVMTAGGTGCYSNFGYMVLARIIETVSGLNHVEFIRRNVLTPNLWVPSTEVFMGHTKRFEQNEREPPYISTSPNCDCNDATNPDPNADLVCCPYGSWHHESFIGHGNLVASAAPLLIFMDNYQVSNGGISGIPLTDGPTSAVRGAHNGSLDGTSATMLQRGDVDGDGTGDGVSIVVLFNQRLPGDSPFILAARMTTIIESTIDDGGFTWPTTCIDGFWIDFDSQASPYHGAYDAPFRTMNQAINGTTSGSKLLLMPGSTDWTGTLATKMRLDAPFGSARIGAQ